MWGANGRKEQEKLASDSNSYDLLVTKDGMPTHQVGVFHGDVPVVLCFLWNCLPAPGLEMRPALLPLTCVPREVCPSLGATPSH